MRLNRLELLLALIVLPATARADLVVFSSFGDGDSFNFDEGLTVVGAGNPFRLPEISQGLAFTPSSTVDLTPIQVAFFGNSDPAISRFGLELHAADAAGNLGTLPDSSGGLSGLTSPAI